MEIEKKYLVTSIPFDLTPYESTSLAQAYISTDPTIRLRSGGGYFLAMKGHGLMAREEYELKLSKEQFDRLWTKIETRAVTKTRYIIPLRAPLKAELDIYSGEHEGLMTVEVEFPSIGEALTFIPPDWFGEDVTEDPSYKNSSLARFGLPKKSGAGAENPEAPKI
ncbi:MAG: CYTH domain-containing protein [Clostridiales bacterium]|jgi:CYTH domain-containing protein|nr:CYTH domain-containing protein [Clostridiales bacterium]